MNSAFAKSSNSVIVDVLALVGNFHKMAISKFDEDFIGEMPSGDELFDGQRSVI